MSRRYIRELNESEESEIFKKQRSVRHQMERRLVIWIGHSDFNYDGYNIDIIGRYIFGDVSRQSFFLFENCVNLGDRR